jgi:7,8-dihydropterin-6-yl-methyl-4-(beta-D-ribofuranosyl)aminobenzene 5'-phosphate synthase
MDNYVDKPHLCAEHGFSCLISFKDKKILFDTGQSSHTKKNGEILNVSFDKVDFVVLSHGHYDHAGGLPFIFHEGLKIYAHKSIAQEHMRSSCPGEYEYIGIDKDFFATHNKSFIFNNSFFEIIPGVILSGNIKRYEPFDADQRLYIKRDNSCEKDIFLDEQYLVVCEDGAYSIFTGCSHAGIVNIIKDFRTKFGDVRIKNIVGGFHLFMSGSKVLENVADCLLHNDVENIFTGHCTGIVGAIYLKQLFGERLILTKVGLEAVI